jgi:hypothetical protein
LLRYGVSAGAFEELIRRVYVEVAETEFQVDGKKQTASRISVITGLNRKEVARIQKLPPVEQSDVDERYNRAVRVITGWLRDNAYRTKAGTPAVLPFEGKKSFSELVTRYSGDMPPRAIADELMRLNIIEESRNNSLKLISKGYIPQDSEVDKLQILGTDTADLIATIEYNLTHSKEEARFQRKVYYDNVPTKYVEPFRRYSAKLSMDLLIKLDAWLAKRDRDSNPDVEGSGKAKVGLGIYMINDRTISPEEDNEN